jgi:iron complex outermembrane recepter protein
MKKTTIASLIGLAFSTQTFAAENINLDDVVVTANRFEHKDTETTYAAEIHTAQEISASGAATLYDFLAQQTALNIQPNYGNKATPSINLRGFGGENGHQNVVITVDGQRLNNVDMSPQLLGAIPLANIERIEISKGSGSVVYGDGATAGAIQIYTKNKTGVSVSTSFGNYGQQNHSLNAGLSEQYFDLSVNLTHDGANGFSEKDNKGYKDESTSDTQNVKLKIKPTDALRFLVEGTSSRNDVRYPSSLTKAQFQENPRQSGGSEYTHQGLDSDQWRVGVEYAINEKLKASATHFREDKVSEYVTYGSIYNYDTEQNDFALSYIGDELSVNGGIQTFDGERSKVASNSTSKDSEAMFIQTEYHPTWLADALTVSAGVRHQEVKYRYAPVTGSTLNASEHLNAWDIGANYRFNTALTAFANLNQSFEAPDIDRFFKFGGGFNGFIAPAKAKTLNIGLNHVLNNNRVKATVFYTKLNNEIYYFQDNTNFIYRNTNIDKSHKYGLELQDSFKFNDQINTSVIYNYTRAIVDKENEGAGTYDGKDLPGVPKHTVVANLNYQFIDHAMFNLNHTWRARAYAYNDFANNASQRQAHYETTNASLSYQYKNMQFFTSVSNLFAHENSTQVSDDDIYPVDFVRTWRVGMKADF